MLLGTLVTCAHEMLLIWRSTTSAWYIAIDVLASVASLYNLFGCVKCTCIIDIIANIPLLPIKAVVDAGITIAITLTGILSVIFDASDVAVARVRAGSPVLGVYYDRWRGEDDILGLHCRLTVDGCDDVLSIFDSHVSGTWAYGGHPYFVGSECTRFEATPTRTMLPEGVVESRLLRMRQRIAIYAPKVDIGARALGDALDSLIADIRGRRATRIYAVRAIDRAWKRASSDPSYAICRRRLLREFAEFQHDLRF